MKPHEELDFLSNFIQLSEDEAVKRDSLERFLEFDEYVLLIDADSIIYNVCHFWKGKELVYSDMIEDFHSQVRAIAIHIEEAGYPVEDIETFFTTCTNNFRLELSKEYKANREVTELSNMVYDLKDVIIKNIEDNNHNIAYFGDTLEADDLIPKYKKIKGKGNEIIVSIDKDLKQINGCHFDYYKNRETKEYRGFSFTSPLEGKKILANLLLIGDAVDNIKGVKGVGKKTVAKLLDGKDSYGVFRTVVEAYIKEGGDWKEKLTINYKLTNLR